jgi:hypothetical protein
MEESTRLQREYKPDNQRQYWVDSNRVVYEDNSTFFTSTMRRCDAMRE